MLEKLVLASLFALLFVPTSGAQNGFVNWESPHVTPLALTPGGGRLLAVNTADNRLEVFDLSSGRPRHERSIPVGLDPVSVRARNRREAWVVNHVSDSVSIVDLEAGHVVATLATDDEPCDVVFAGKPRRAFVSCSQANSVLVFDPFLRTTPPVRVELRGEDPRALAVSPTGDRVYVAIFESGNGTTGLGGGAMVNIGYPPNVVDDPLGPYGGVNPPPNAGAAFEPPMSAGLPAPPRAALIVRRSAAGKWLDDNGADWTELVSGPNAARSGRPLGWTLLDHDVAVLDVATLDVSYVDGLMNLNMALGVNPATGALAVVGTEATNEIRFEPNVSGRFVRAHLALVAPGPGAVDIRDMNRHLDYSGATVPQSERDLSLADPRGVAWSADGKRAYVTGMGSNNVVVLDADGARVGAGRPIEVGEGPTGIVLDENRRQLYVLDKFAAALSVVDLATEVEVERVPFFDPSPSAIKAGRKHLYDTHETSGTGLVACASCHVDGRIDRLAWDLGDPSGTMKNLDPDDNDGAGLLTGGFAPWHPMKGPMLTQTLQDIIGKEPHHWRGDRDGLEEFNPAFLGLLGDDEPLSAAEMQEFEDFVATLFLPPNPYRNLDNTLPTSLPLPGHFKTGRFGPAGQPLPNGNAVRGEVLFRPPNFLDVQAIACVTCHTRPTGASTDKTLVNGRYRPINPGPNGENHLALVSVDGLTNITMKVPQLRTLYERTGFNTTQLESTAGFGYLHDGTVDSIERFIDEPVFNVRNDQDTADLTAFMLAFSGVSASQGSPTALFEPPGPASQATHAAVGRQLTLDGPPDDAETALLDALIALAQNNAVGLVARGRKDGHARSWFLASAGVFQSDRRSETATRGGLEALAGPGTELTFTAVPEVSEVRIGVDQDSDGLFDRDERDRRSNPADANDPAGPVLRTKGFARPGSGVAPRAPAAPVAGPPVR